MSSAEREVWLNADRRWIPTGRSRGPRLALAPDASSGGFTVERITRRGRTVVRPVGELDLSTAPRLEESVDEALAAGSDEVILDLEHLHFCDAAGLHLFLRVRQRAGRHGTRLWLERPTRTVRRVLEISDLGWLVDEVGADGDGSDGA